MIRRICTFLLGFGLLVPVALLAMLSIARHWRFPDVLPDEWQLMQWHEIFRSGSGLAGLMLRSIAMSIGVSVTATLLALPTSRALARHPRGALLFGVAHLPFTVSPVVLGASLLYGFVRLQVAGTVAGVMVAQFVLAYAYGVILLSSFWNPMIHEWTGLAETLGATPRQVWTRVLLPRAAPLVAVCLFQCFLISWFDYAIASLVGGGAVETLTVRLFQLLGSGDTRLASVCGLLLVLPPVAALILKQQLLLARLPLLDSTRNA